jgi:hypothetical protein
VSSILAQTTNARQRWFFHRLDFATRSNSSFFCEKRRREKLNKSTKMIMKVEPTLIAYEFDDPFAAFISSSAKHSAIDLTFRNADSRVCVSFKSCGRTESRSSTYTDGQERDGLVNPSKRGDINGLSSDGSLGANTRRIFTRSRVYYGIYQDLCNVSVEIRRGGERDGKPG